VSAKPGGASLVALGGEVSWQWQDHFRVAATTQAAVHKFEVPVSWGGCGDSLLAIAPPEDSVADYVAACRATGQKPFSWTVRISSFKGLPA
jgi:hypothetical protein